MSFEHRPLITRPAATILVAGAGLSLIAVMHHPVVHARAPHQVMTGITNIAPMDQAVHATLIAVMLLMLYAFCVLTYALRGRGALETWALASFALGCGGVIGATLIDGFFVPAIGARYALLAPGLQSSAIPLLTAGAIAIQILTKFGFYAMCAAALAWACELLTRTGPLRIAGGAAAIAALGEAVLVATAGTLQPHNLAMVTLLQAVWCAAFAWALWSMQE